MKIELHLIQNFAPSNLNRDDTNAPKDCEFGGYRRARISSQCQKRAIRMEFENNFELTNAIRTKLIFDPISKKLQEAGKDENLSYNIACSIVEVIGGKETKSEKSKVLLFLGKDEIDGIVELIIDNWDKLEPISQEIINNEDDKKKKEAAVKKLETECDKTFKTFKKEISKKGTSAIDLALFGRMMAEHPDMKVNAACQVAHALSTHQVAMEMDFYTAMDDLTPNEEQGAGMMGIVEFNSSCFYRYSAIDYNLLVENLGGNVDLAQEGVIAYIKAAINAIPTGKQNSMAAQNRPSFIMVTVRNNGYLCSLANAFIKPVQKGYGKNIIEESVKQLDEYWKKITKAYGKNDDEEIFLINVEGYELSTLKDYSVQSVDELIENIKTTMNK